MSGAFPISTADFQTLGIKSVQNTLVSKSISGKKLSRQVDNSVLQLVYRQKIRHLWRTYGFHNEAKIR